MTTTELHYQLTKLSFVESLHSRIEKMTFYFGRTNQFGGKRDSRQFPFTNRSYTSSENMVDDQIAIAIRTRDTLRNQRSAMKSIQTQLTTIASKS